MLVAPVRASVLVLCAVVIALFADACSDGTGAPRCDGAVCRGTGGDGGRDGARNPEPTDLLTLEIQPADPVLNATDGAHPMQQFTALGHQRDGRTRTVTGVRFSIADSTLGTLDATTGLFVSAGLGGATHVQAATLDGSGLTATTSLTIDTQTTVLGPGVTMADVDRVEHGTLSPMSTLGPSIDYPLEGAVMPRNVFPPKMMWTVHHASPAATDVFRVQLDRPHASLRGYFLNAAALNDAWQIERDAWAAVAGSDVGQPIVSRVSVLSGTTVFAGAARSFKTIDGVIAGAVYYWSPTQMRLRRIDVEPAALVDFMPNPGAGCIGCHAVSRDGRRLEGFLEQPAAGDPGESLAAYDLTRSLTAAPAPRLFRVAYNYRRCSSFNNEATRLVAGGCGANDIAALSIIDMATGMEMPGVGTSIGQGFDPEWSPDDHSIAFTNAHNDLVVASASAGDTYGAPTMLHSATSTPGGTFDWHPSFTPDSAWLAFQHGTTRRTALSVDGSMAAQGQIFLIARAGGTPVRLDHLNGGADVSNSFRPIFSPFDSGGDFWVLFTTTRDYGNAQAGLRNMQQIWVAAIHDHPDGTSDPSEVPYYLAGQEAVIALSPYWAPPPCRSNGNACSTGGDCCSGTCGPDDQGNDVCRSGTACQMRGATCDTSADCCNGMTCNAGHLCDQPPPG